MSRRNARAGLAAVGMRRVGAVGAAILLGCAGGLRAASAAQWDLDTSGALLLNFDRPSGAYVEDEFKRWESSVRSAELEFELDYGERWSATLELGMGRGDAEPQVDDAYLEFEVNDWLALRGGRFKPDYGLENSSSGKRVWFNERAMAADSLAAERGDGIGAEIDIDHVFVAVAFTRRDNDEDDAQLGGFHARGVYTGDPGKDRHWHIGTSLGQIAYDGAQHRVRSDAELNISGSILRSPNNVDAVDVLLQAFDAAWVRGPLAVQGEFLTQAVDPVEGDDFKLDGYALSASWFLDDSHHRYKDGSLRDPDLQGDRAIELVARHGCLDLRARGKGDAGCTASLGINYYWKKRMRLGADYIRLDRDDGEPSGKAWSLRAQWRF